MPSWKVHRLVCEKLLGFYEEEIDRIVDELLGHDSSRYDVEALAKAVALVRRRYGYKGVAQLVLHHYLDRLSDRMASEMATQIEFLAHGIVSPEEAATRFLDRISWQVDRDPNNALNLLIHAPEELEPAISAMYIGRSKRRRRKEVTERLRANYKKLAQYAELTRLKPMIEEIAALAKRNLSFIIDTIIQHDERTLWRALHATGIKMLAEGRLEKYDDLAKKFLKALLEKLPKF